MAFQLKGNAAGTLDAIVEQFKAGNVPAAIARTVIDRQVGDGSRPIDGWSFRNQLLAHLLGNTDDARTFKQWIAVGRVVRKGSKAPHLLAPILGSYEAEDADGNTERRSYLRGLKSFPVFPYEKTDILPENKRKGPAYVAADYVPDELPPLHQVADAWGVQVTYSPFRGSAYGWASVDGSAIGLHTEDITTWLHELAHVAEARTRSDISGGQHWDQEVVAETVSAVLSSLLGIESNLGDSYRYISHYAKTQDLEPAQAVLKVLSRILDAVEAILAEAEVLGQVHKAAA